MQIILEKIEVYGYLILYFSSFGGSFLGIMGAGILSSFGKLDLMLSILIASCGNISGSMIIAYLARFNKRFFIAKKWKRKRAIVSVCLEDMGVMYFYLANIFMRSKALCLLLLGLAPTHCGSFGFGILEQVCCEE